MDGGPRPAPRIPYAAASLSEAEQRARGEAFYRRMAARRSVRDFDSRPVPRALVERAIATAGTAPSGAHQQPWTFVAVSDPALKRQIREAAEVEERAFYAERATEAWLRALAPIGTDADKPFLEAAPWLVVLFAQTYGVSASGERHKHYYVAESCGIAAGLFIAALHEVGLATLTHTPSPMGFLREVLGRPEHERPFILFPVGYPAPGATVPALARKPIAEIAIWR